MNREFRFYQEHPSGRWYVDLPEWEGENPNGSRNSIAGITNAKGNVVGLMPHPEHAINELTGPSAQGLGFFTSILNAMVK